MNWHPGARILANERGIFLSTYSGLARRARDPDGVNAMLQAAATVDEIGATLRLALGASRQISLEEIPIFFNPEKTNQAYKSWVAWMMRGLGYKTKRALFSNMKSIGISQLADHYELRPSRHERLEGWSGEGVSPSDYVLLPLSATDAELGAGALLALGRCK